MSYTADHENFGDCAVLDTIGNGASSVLGVTGLCLLSLLIGIFVARYVGIMERTSRITRNVFSTELHEVIFAKGIYVENPSKDMQAARRIIRSYIGNFGGCEVKRHQGALSWLYCESWRRILHTLRQSVIGSWRPSVANDHMGCYVFNSGWRMTNIKDEEEDIHRLYARLTLGPDLLKYYDQIGPLDLVQGLFSRFGALFGSVGRLVRDQKRENQKYRLNDHRHSLNPTDSDEVACVPSDALIERRFILLLYGGTGGASLAFASGCGIALWQKRRWLKWCGVVIGALACAGSFFLWIAIDYSWSWSWPL